MPPQEAASREIMISSRTLESISSTYEFYSSSQRVHREHPLSLPARRQPPIDHGYWKLNGVIEVSKRVAPGNNAWRHFRVKALHPAVSPVSYCARIISVLTRFPTSAIGRTARGVALEQ